ncbi:MAG: mechanosensitive ion channel family protein [Candidatus Thorarchaeota archaeon]
MQIPPDFFTDPIGFISYHWILIFPYLFLLFQLIVLVLIYMIIVRLAKRSVRAVGMGTEAASGITMVLRLMFFMAGITIVVGILDPTYSTVISLAALFGTALGLAFSQAMGNIVSGLYVFAARPFRVGDYVRIGTVEGIVDEITLNYTNVLLSDETRKLVPNSKVVSSEVTNFVIQIDDYIVEKEEEKVHEVEGRSGAYRRALDLALNTLKELTDEDEAYRYTFDLTIHMSRNHNKICKIFDKVCTKWESRFLTRPTYVVWNKPSAAITYRFAFIVVDPMVIVKSTSQFMRDLLDSYYNP